jgi:hypothetical protein
MVCILAALFFLHFHAGKEGRLSAARPVSLSPPLLLENAPIYATGLFFFILGVSRQEEDTNTVINLDH